MRNGRKTPTSLGSSPTTSASLSIMALGVQSSGWYTASTVSVMKIHWNLYVAIVQPPLQSKETTPHVHLELLCLQHQEQIKKLAGREKHLQGIRSIRGRICHDLLKQTNLRKTMSNSQGRSRIYTPTPQVRPARSSRDCVAKGDKEALLHRDKVHSLQPVRYWPARCRPVSR